jgi:hypothetical protein
MENLPYEMNYNIETMDEALEQKLLKEWDAITYNDHYYYNANEIVCKRIPFDYSHIPGFDIIVNEMIVNLQNATLLEEYFKQMKVKE